MNLEFKTVSGQSIEPYLSDLASLRIQVFREYPYIYDGDHEYEMKYLKTYVDSERSMVALALDGDKVVGASSCVPLGDEWDDFKKPFKEQGFNIERIFYFGESILLPEYRGQKAGHIFFDLREEHALEMMADLEATVFCAVDRGDNHPLRSKDYKPLDSFWQRMGYRKHEDMVAKTAWKDIDKDVEDAKPLIFWIKRWL